jgi:hypothetical protein
MRLENVGGRRVFVFTATDGRKWEEPAIECTICMGQGEHPADRPVVDYVNGGYIEEIIITCEDCGGYGYIPDDGEEEE